MTGVQTCALPIYIHNEQQQIKLSLPDSKKATKQLHNIKLPLSEDQRIQCNTCHYIHGSLGTDAVVYDGSGDNQYFLRLPKEQLCYACHDL